MKTVRCHAQNIKTGDVYQGRRIKGIHGYLTRTDSRVMLITSHPDGYKLETFDLSGKDAVTVKRPKYNLGKKRK